MSKTTFPACPVFCLPVPWIHCHCLRRSPSLLCQKSRPPTHLRVRSPHPTGAPQLLQPGSRSTDFLLLLTPESSGQKGAPAPGATPPRSSPSARKMANNQGNNNNNAQPHHQHRSRVSKASTEQCRPSLLSVRH